MSPYIRIFLAFISAILSFIAFVGFDQWYLAFVSWVPILLAVEGLSFKNTFLLALFMGTIAHLGGYYWLPTTIKTFGLFPWPLALMFSLFLNIYQGLSFALMILARKIIVKGGYRSIFLGALPFPAIEEIYPNLFPIYWGNTLYKVPVAVQSIDLFGLPFLTLLIILVNIVITELFCHILFRNRKINYFEILAVAIIWVLALVYGALRIGQIEKRMEQAEKIKIGVVQGNLGLMEKREAPEESLRRHITISSKLVRRGAQLLVWSESAVNFAIPEKVKNVKRVILGPISTPTIFGAIRTQHDGGKRYEYNTAFLTDENGQITGYYDKVYLLAFGEYIPFGDWFPKLYEWSPNSGAFKKGKPPSPLIYKNHRLGIMICYEDIIPRFVRQLMSSPEGPSELFINITNDAWFGNTNEPWIHLGLATARSIEHRKWLIRSTNSGVSAAIDPAGRITVKTQVMKQESFLVEAGFMQMKTLYQSGGWMFGYLCLIIAVCLIVKNIAGMWRSKNGEKEKRKYKKKK